MRLSGAMKQNMPVYFKVFPPKTDEGMDRAADINRRIFRSGCVMPRKLCEIIFRN